MNFVGIDLHKKTISLCVVDQERNVLNRRQINCSEPGRIVAFFEQLGPFQAVVEATARYEWLIELIEPMADRVVLAHPKKPRIIAETEPRVRPAAKRKSDKLDAQVLAEFLALDIIPQAYRPSPRQREFAASARAREAEARTVLDTIPGVGPVTVDTVLSELGDVRRFRSAKQVCAYAGPGSRSAGIGRTHQTTGDHQAGVPDAALGSGGSGLQLVYRTRRWGAVFEAPARRRGKKRAIVAIARRLLCAREGTAHPSGSG